MRKLFYGGTDKLVEIGDKTKTGKGEECEVTEIIEPDHQGSTGRVRLRFIDGGGLYFPNVINAEWRICRE